MCLKWLCCQHFDFPFFFFLISRHDGDFFYSNGGTVHGWPPLNFHIHQDQISQKKTLWWIDSNDRFRRQFDQFFFSVPFSQFLFRSRLIIKHLAYIWFLGSGLSFIDSQHFFLFRTGKRRRCCRGDNNELLTYGLLPSRGFPRQPLSLSRVDPLRAKTFWLKCYTSTDTGGAVVWHIRLALFLPWIFLFFSRLNSNDMHMLCPYIRRKNKII